MKSFVLLRISCCCETIIDCILESSGVDRNRSESNGIQRYRTESMEIEQSRTELRIQIHLDVHIVASDCRIIEEEYWKSAPSFVPETATNQRTKLEFNFKPIRNSKLQSSSHARSSCLCDLSNDHDKERRARNVLHCCDQVLSTISELPHWIREARLRFLFT